VARRRFRLGWWHERGQLRPPLAHIKMIHGPDGKKLSKRHGATAVGDYSKLGILSDALRNFLALLGWNPKDEREVFSDVNDLVAAFNLSDVQRKSAIFDQAKLEWMNGQYIALTPNEELLPLVEPEMAKLGVDIDGPRRDRFLRAMDVNRERARTTLELAERTAVRLERRFMVEDDAKAQKLIAKDGEKFYSALREAFMLLNSVEQADWEPDRLEQELRQLAEKLEVGAGKVFQPIRVALTGTTVSEPVNVLLDVVGREESLGRIELLLGRAQ